jgi:hypothetical protein
MLIVVVVDSGNAPIVEAKDDRVLPLQRDPASLSGGAHGEEHSAGVQIVNLSRQEPKDTRVHRASEGELLLSCPSQDGLQTFLKAGEKQSPRLSELRRLAAQSGVGVASRRTSCLTRTRWSLRAKASRSTSSSPTRAHQSRHDLDLPARNRPEEIIAAVRARHAPMMSASAGLQL